MSEFLEIVVGEETFRFHSRKQLMEWWKAEHAKWEWLWANRRNEFNHVSNQANSLNAEIGTADPQSLLNTLSEFFNRSRMGVPYSGSIDGERYLNALKLTSPEETQTLIIIEQNQNIRHQLQNQTWAYQFSRAVAASYAGVGADRVEMAAERRNYKHASDRLEQRVRDLEGEKEDFVRRRARYIRKVSRLLQKRTSSIWRRTTADFLEQRDKALFSIAETEELYRAQMALKAPVEYWRIKAGSHGKWEIAWAIGMLFYFIGAATAIFKIAQWAAKYLLAVPDGVHTTPIYIIVSGATLGATTLIFWIGRLVAKLFLSEHHLRSDAREKAVMTQAFLSMETRETFSKEERAIILASIFRTSPDGIVKDEGPADLNTPSLLAKLVSGR